MKAYGYFCILGSYKLFGSNSFVVDNVGNVSKLLISKNIQCLQTTARTSSEICLMCLCIIFSRCQMSAKIATPFFILRCRRHAKIYFINRLMIIFIAFAIAHTIYVYQNQLQGKFVLVRTWQFLIAVCMHTIITYYLLYFCIGF